MLKILLRTRKTGKKRLFVDDALEELTLLLRKYTKANGGLRGK